jgi:hypothetical protein
VKIAALVILALYVLLGVRSIFWYRTVHGILSDLRPKSPWWYIAVVLVVAIPFDIVLWPINAIINRRKAASS